MTHASQKRLSFALIGAGAFGAHYIRLLRNNPRAILSAVVNPSGEKRGLDLGPETRRYADATKVFEDPAINAVIIATPVSTHKELAVAALHGGKHVLLEKPLALDQGEANEIAEAVASSRKVFMLGHQYLYNDHIAALKHEIDSGRIGRVRYVSAEQCYAGKMRFDVGCFRETATHEIGLIDYLFSPGKPLAVCASGIDFTGEKREDVASATIHYENGLFAHIMVSWFSPLRIRRILLGGELGMGVFDDQATGDKVSFSMRPFPFREKQEQSRTILVPEGPIFAPTVPSHGEPLHQELEHFFNCIESNTAPRSDILHAMRVEGVLSEVERVMRIV